MKIGQAYIFLYPGDNSIIIYGAANMDWKNNDLSKLEVSLDNGNYVYLLFINSQCIVNAKGNSRICKHSSS